MGAVKNLCSRGILMQQGQMHAIGSSKETVDMYLKDCSAASAFRLKTNADSYLKTCYVVNEVGEPVNVGLTCDTLVIRIRYRNSRKHRALRFGISLISADGVLITSSSPEDVRVPTNGDPGVHQFVARIPQHTLMGGGYTIDAALWDQLEGIVYDNVRGAAAFHLEAGGGVYLHDPTRKGTVQNLLEWENH